MSVGYNDLINYQSKLLNDFYNIGLTISNYDDYVYYKSTWDRYSDILKTENSEIRTLYNMVKNKLNSLKEKYSYSELDKNKIDEYKCDTIKSKEEEIKKVKMIIDQKIDFFLDSFNVRSSYWYSRRIVTDIIHFFNWSVSIFTCMENMYIFRPKYEQILYEAKKTIKHNIFDEKTYSELVEIFKKINFSKSWFNNQ
jgi:hypothetical protein